MAKPQKTARELARMVAERIGAPVTSVVVEKDANLGWHPTVYALPEQAAALQRQAELAAQELRTHYDLAD